MLIFPQHNEYDSLARIASFFCKVPISIIAVEDEEHRWILSEIGINDFKAEYLLSSEISNEEIFEITDFKERNLYPHPFLSDNNIRFYAETPLVVPNGRIGYLCIMDTIPKVLDESEKESLKILARQISELIELKKQNERLEENIQVFQYFLTNSSEIVVILNAQSLVFETVNEEFYRLTGYSANQPINFIDIIHPSDKDLVESLFKNREGEFLKEFETNVVCNNKEERFFKFKSIRKENKIYLHARDITEKRKTKKSLIENEERYRRLSEFAFESIAIHEGGKIVDCNLTFPKTFGYDPDEVMGLNLFHFFPRIYREILNKDSSLTEDRRLETMCVRKDSSTFPAEVMIKTIENNGHIVNAIAIRDNTERKKLENELLKSTVFQKAILDSSSFAIISTDFYGLVKTFNKGAEKMLGAKTEEVVEKKNIVELHLEDEIKERAKQLSEELNKVVVPGFDVFVEKLKTLYVDESEWTYVLKPDNKIVVSVTVTTLKDNLGEITGYLFMGTDISDKKKAEAEIIDKSQLLNGIVSNMPVFVFKVDKKGVFTQSIGTGLNNLGLQENAMVGMNIFETFPLVTDFVEKAYRGEYVSFINSTVAKDKELYYEYFIFPDLTIQGGLIGFALDITDRIISEQKLKDSADDLAKINRELDQFAYIVSHDLKAPLRAIASLSEWIEEDIGPDISEDVKNNMGILRGRVQRMQNLIDGILSYSRVGRIKVNYEEVNLDELVREVISVVGVPEKFLVEIPQKLPVIHSNSTWLEQVFSNLISNSIKYHDKPKGKILIGFEDDNKFYKFSIADDGPGISSEFHEKIFVIFQTLEAKDTKESTGVGLAIVKKIIEEQGGKIWVESNGTLGAKFIFTLPKNPIN